MEYVSNLPTKTTIKGSVTRVTWPWNFEIFGPLCIWNVWRYGLEILYVDRVREILSCGRQITPKGRVAGLRGRFWNFVTPPHFLQFDVWLHYIRYNFADDKLPSPAQTMLGWSQGMISATSGNRWRWASANISSFLYKYTSSHFLFSKRWQS